MNKVYKVVWSKVRNCYVVVSEIAKNHTKNVRSGLAGGRALSVLLISALLCTPASFVQATIDDGAAYIKVDSKLQGVATADGNGIALGEGASVKNSTGNSTAIGHFTIVNGEGSIAIGSAWESYADTSNANYRNGNMPRTTVKGNNSMAIGNAKTIVAGNNNIAVGAGSQVGIDKDAWERDYTVQASATGVENGTAVGSEAKVSGNQGSAVGFNAQARGKSAVAMGVKALATGESSVAAGNEAKALGAKSIALGDGADAEDDYAMAIGNTASAKGQDSMAIGNQTTTDGNSSLAVGNQAMASGDYSMAQGIMAIAAGTSSLAAGEDASAMADYSVALGSGAYVGVSDGVALGSLSESNRTGGIFGYDPLTNKTSEENTSVWKSNVGAASVGNTMMASGEVSTRQIIGVAAGSEDTDAVNVAQLKRAKNHYYSIGNTFNVDAQGYAHTADGDYITDEIGIGERYSRANISNTDWIPLTSNYENEGAVGAASLAAGPYAYAGGDRSVAVGNGAIARDKGSVVIGNHATSEDNFFLYGDQIENITGTTVIGNYARAYLSGAVALGSHAESAGGVAIGEEADVMYGSGVSVGRKSYTGGENAVAIGNGAKAGYAEWAVPTFGDGGESSGNYLEGYSGNRTIALGNQAEAMADDSIAIGTKAKTKAEANLYGPTENKNSIALGNSAEADGINTMALGFSAWALKKNAIAQGNQAWADGISSIALGDSAAATGNTSVALGKEAKAQNDYAMALGDNAQATTVGGVALGTNSVADRGMGIAGYDPSTGAASVNTSPVWKSMASAVSVGNVNGSVTRQIIGVAAGSEDTDAVNVAQLKTLRSDLQTDVANGKTHYYSVKSSAQDTDSNYNNDGAKGENALAAGSYASAQKESVAIGYKAQAQDARSVVIGIAAKTMDTTDGGNISIGYGSQAGQKVDSGSSGLAAAVGMNAKATGWGSSAYGTEAKAQGSWSTAVGDWAQANTTKGRGGTAIGTTAKADDDYATAVGLGAEATAVNSTALGMQAKATQKDSVALGAGSVDRAATKETKGTITLSDGTTRDFGNFAGNNPTGVVSVGAKDKERQVINVAAGKVSADSTDAINGSQLYSLAGEVGKNAEAIAKNTQDISNIKNNITNLTTEAGKHTTVKAGTNENLTITEGTNTEGGKEYTVDLSDKLTIGKAGAKGTDGHMGINGKDGVSGVGIDGKDGISVKGDKGEVGINGKDGISVKGDKGEVGINGNDGISIKGKDGKDAVSINGKDGVGHIGLTGPAGTNGKDGTNAVDISVKNGYDGADGTKGASGVDGNNGITRIVYEDKNGEHQVATLDDGMKYGGDTGDIIKKKLNNQVNVIGGIRDTSKLTAVDNIGVVSDGTDNLKVRLAKNLNLGNDGSVTTGDTTINNNGVTIHNGPSITKDGIDAGGKTISNVANGTNATDAVNKGQLDEAVRTTNSEVSRVAHGLARLDSRVNKVGANAAALAALHPQDFDPDDKWDFAAGYGNYKDAHAVAVGAFYRPNEDTMLSVGGSFGGGENMVNAGVTFKLGQHNHVTTSRVAMAKDMLAMKAQIENLTKKLAAYEAGQPVKLASTASGAMTFPDVPENHWAYEYVKSLAERGYLKGYPDGEFKGDRAMTRYEYAAIIYRALQNGAPSDGNMTRSVDEFGPELIKVQNIDRFRVDRISGKDNDRHKVERVRVNDKDDKAKNVFRDVYGSHIQK